MVKEVRGEGMLAGIEFQPPSNLSMRSEIKGCFQGDVGVSPHPGLKPWAILLDHFMVNWQKGNANRELQELSTLVWR
jgi:hypothetical protein